eukprot:TRINITY_DN4900_c0_g1_i1.p1 TRINITY_DN4900_c0_g1~~TRINITY_DN4900_c0_g1_i1.p1  ORF type:complete len:1680 (-),score=289.68 TRINITY_DN4900_c0_g1_i1:483-5522(-)
MALNAQATCGHETVAAVDEQEQAATLEFISKRDGDAPFKPPVADKESTLFGELLFMKIWPMLQRPLSSTNATTSQVPEALQVCAKVVGMLVQLSVAEQRMLVGCKSRLHQRLVEALRVLGMKLMPADANKNNNSTECKLPGAIPSEERRADLMFLALSNVLGDRSLALSLIGELLARLSAEDVVDCLLDEKRLRTAVRTMSRNLERELKEEQEARTMLSDFNAQTQEENSKLIARCNALTLKGKGQVMQLLQAAVKHTKKPRVVAVKVAKAYAFSGQLLPQNMLTCLSQCQLAKEDVAALGVRFAGEHAIQPGTEKPSANTARRKAQRSRSRPAKKQSGQQVASPTDASMPSEKQWGHAPDYKHGTTAERESKPEPRVVEPHGSDRWVQPQQPRYSSFKSHGQRDKLSTSISEKSKSKQMSDAMTSSKLQDVARPGRGSEPELMRSPQWGAGYVAQSSSAPLAHGVGKDFDAEPSRFSGAGQAAVLPLDSSISRSSPRETETGGDSRHEAKDVQRDPRSQATWASARDASEEAAETPILEQNRSIPDSFPTLETKAVSTSRAVRSASAEPLPRRSYADQLRSPPNSAWRASSVDTGRSQANQPKLSLGEARRGAKKKGHIWTPVVDAFEEARAKLAAANPGQSATCEDSDEEQASFHPVPKQKSAPTVSRTVRVQQTSPSRVPQQMTAPTISLRAQLTSPSRKVSQPKSAPMRSQTVRAQQTSPSRVPQPKSAPALSRAVRSASAEPFPSAERSSLPQSTAWRAASVETDRIKTHESTRGLRQATQLEEPRRGTKKRGHLWTPVTDAFDAAYAKLAASNAATSTGTSAVQNHSSTKHQNATSSENDSKQTADGARTMTPQEARLELQVIAELKLQAVADENFELAQKLKLEESKLQQICAKDSWAFKVSGSQVESRRSPTMRGPAGAPKAVAASSLPVKHDTPLQKNTGNLVFVLTAPGELKAESFKPTATHVGRRDALARIATAALWRGRGLAWNDVREVVFLFEDNYALRIQPRFVSSCPVPSEYHIIMVLGRAVETGGAPGASVLPPEWDKPVGGHIDRIVGDSAREGPTAVALLHEAYTQNLGLFSGDNIAEHSEDQHKTVIFFLGAVKDMSPTETRAVERACRVHNVPCVQASLGQQAEFTSKIIDVLHGHHLFGRLAPAIWRFARRPPLGGTASGQEIAAGMPAVSKNPPSGTFWVFVPVGGAPMDLAADDRKTDGLYEVPRCCISQLWCSKNEHRCHAISFVFPAGDVLTVNASLVTCLKMQHRAAPTEVNLVTALRAAMGDRRAASSLNIEKGCITLGKATDIRQSREGQAEASLDPKRTVLVDLHVGDETGEQLVPYSTGSSNGKRGVRDVIVLFRQAGGRDFPKGFREKLVEGLLGERKQIPSDKKVSQHQWLQLSIPRLSVHAAITLIGHFWDMRVLAPSLADKLPKSTESAKEDKLFDQSQQTSEKLAGPAEAKSPLNGAADKIHSARAKVSRPDQVAHDTAPSFNPPRILTRADNQDGNMQAGPPSAAEVASSACVANSSDPEISKITNVRSGCVHASSPVRQKSAASSSSPLPETMASSDRAASGTALETLQKANASAGRSLHSSSPWRKQKTTQSSSPLPETMASSGRTASSATLETSQKSNASAPRSLHSSSPVRKQKTAQSSSPLPERWEDLTGSDDEVNSP